jgi:hypothetical protein
VGTDEKLLGIIERLKQHFKEVRYRGDSAFYDKKIVQVCEEKGVEFFIVADQTKKLLSKVLELEEEHWKPFYDGKKQGEEEGSETEKGEEPKEGRCTEAQSYSEG